MQFYCFCRRQIDKLMPINLAKSFKITFKSFFIATQVYEMPNVKIWFISDFISIWTHQMTNKKL